MRQSTLTLAILALAISVSALADTPTSKNIANPNEFMQIASDSSSSSENASKQCEGIAKACLVAGYTREGGAGKAFWADCMKPILLGKTINGITISRADVSTCRQQKVENMKQELQQLQQAMSEK